MKELTIVRGLPGSGKSTYANSISEKIFEADQFFYDKNGQYNFDYKKIKEAHNDCFKRFKEAVDAGCESIAVSNTFTKEWEFLKYKKYAEKHGYLVFVVIVENRHGSKSIHGVPDTDIKRMRERFKIKL